MKETPLLPSTEKASSNDVKQAVRASFLAGEPVQDGRPEVVADRQLVDDCLTGQKDAWERLYHRCHPYLVAAVRKYLGGQANDQQLVEEIVAQVWFLVIQNDGQMLDRFSAQRDRRLTSYLGGFAHNQVRAYARSEKRRHLREAEATRGHRVHDSMHAERDPLEMQDFISTLSDRERKYVAWCMLPPSDEPDGKEPFSATENSDRQLRHRLRSKMRDFFDRK